MEIHNGLISRLGIDIWHWALILTLGFWDIGYRYWYHSLLWDWSWACILIKMLGLDIDIDIGMLLGVVIIMGYCSWSLILDVNVKIGYYTFTD